MRGTARSLLNLFAQGWVISRPLLHPPDKPLFKSLLKHPHIRSYSTWFPLLLSGITCCGLWAALAFLRGSADGLVFTAFIAANVGMFVGWTSSIATSLVREHENGMYALLCVMPEGAQGADWAMCLTKLHKGDALLVLYYLRLILTLGIEFTVVVVTLGLSKLDPSSRIVVPMLGLFAYLDQVQSVVLAGLVGMIVPYYARNGFDARMWAVVGFLLSQTFPFLAAILIDRVFSSSQNGSVTGLLAGMLTFYVGREVIIRWLCHMLSLKWNSRTVEP